MLSKIFTKENTTVNAFLAAIIFVVYIVFLGHTFGEAFTTSLLFFGLLFLFDWVIAMFRDRA